MTFEVVSGGTPSSEELAAVVVALAPGRLDDPPAHEHGPSGWRRAAMLESVGGSRVVRPAELTSPPGGR